MVTVTELFERHVIRAVLNQARLRGIVGGAAWSAHITTGTLEFKGVGSFNAEVVGTASPDAGTFLWAWDHPSVPAHRAALARRVRDYGIAEDCAALKERTPSVTVLDAHRAGVIATGVTGADAYYVGRYSRTEVVFVLLDDALRARPYPLTLFMTDLTSLMAEVAFGHEDAIGHFAAQPPPGLDVRAEGNVITLTTDHESLDLRVDAAGRVTVVRAETPTRTPLHRRAWRQRTRRS